MHYDTMITEQMNQYTNGHAVNLSRVFVDQELEDNLRTFKAESSEEVECRRELLRYKRRIDDVVRELLRLHDEASSTQEGETG